MRYVTAWVLVLLLAGVAGAEEGRVPSAPAPGAEGPPGPTGVMARKVVLPSKVTALRGSAKQDAWTAGLASGEVVRLDRHGKVTWRVRALAAPITKLCSSPSGKLLAVASDKELVLVDATAGTVRWKQPAPVAFTFSADRSRLRIVQSTGGLAELSATSGEVLDRRAFQEKRTVEEADFSPDGATIVLGVSDG